MKSSTTSTSVILAPLNPTTTATTPNRSLRTTPAAA